MNLTPRGIFVRDSLVMIAVVTAIFVPAGLHALFF